MNFRWFTAVLAAFTVFTAADIQAAPLRQKQLAGKSYYHLGDIMRKNGAAVSSWKNQSTITGRNFRGTLRQKNRKFIFNGVKIDLNYPPQYQSGIAYISAFDWNKSFRPLLNPESLQKHSISTITIDMGHGGKDPGAIGRLSREKHITLALGRRVAEVLRACGYNVKLTRNSDVQIPLAKVSALQRKHGSDLFISLHVNAADDRTISGIETFCLTPAGAPSSNTGKIQDSTYYGNRFDANNLALAYQLQKAMLRRTGAADRGVKHANFMVLRNINVPGVLIEVGFISNRIEEQKLISPAYIDKLARGIAEGIIAYRMSFK